MGRLEIVPTARIGQGDRERNMIELIHRSGWYGPTGIIAHDRKQDAAVTLQENLTGLEQILHSIGDLKGFQSFRP